MRLQEMASFYMTKERLSAWVCTTKIVAFAVNKTQRDLNSRPVQSPISTVPGAAP